MASASIISRGTVVIGRITASTDLEVHGRIEGSIEARGDVTVAADARVKSSIAATRVLVAGAVAGDLRGTELVVLEAGARVVGDVTAPAIGIRPGALLRGRVETGSSAAEAPTRRTSAVGAGAQAHQPAKQARAVTGANVGKGTSAARPPAPVMPAASGTATRASGKAKAKAPPPVVPALKKHTTKAARRRAR